MLNTIGFLGSTASPIPEHKTCTTCASGGNSSFDAVLASLGSTSSTANITAGISRSTQTQVDPQDEVAATKELLALMKMLVAGKIDYSAINNSDTNAQAADGPVRSQLEIIKTIIRKVISPGVSSGSSNLDNMSLKDLLDQLPDEVKALLKKALPNLDELLEKEAEKSAKEQRDRSTRLANDRLAASAVEISPAAFPINQPAQSEPPQYKIAA